MKKTLAMFFALVMLFCLCACSNSDNQTTEPSQSTTGGTETPTDGTEAPTDGTEDTTVTTPPTNPATQPTKPIEDTPQPTSAPTEPTTAAPDTQPPESTAPPTTQPTEPTTNPTEDTTQPTTPAAPEPTDPISTDSTESTEDPDAYYKENWIAPDPSLLTFTQEDVGKWVGKDAGQDLYVIRVEEGVNTQGLKYIQVVVGLYGSGWIPPGFVRMECRYCHEFPCPAEEEEDCPQYDEKFDPGVTCQDCGKPWGDGTNGTCISWPFASVNCPTCGEFVQQDTCHSCFE